MFGLVLLCMVDGVRNFKVCLIFLVGLLSYFMYELPEIFEGLTIGARIIIIFKRISSFNQTISWKH